MIANFWVHPKTTGMFRPLLLTMLVLVIGQAAQAADYYWVEDAGDWSELRHWATTSGGTTKHKAVPTINDQVFFDANSGNSIRTNIDVEHVYCRSMNWTGALGAPTLSGTADKAIHIFGSLTFVATLKQEFKGDFYFEGDHVGNLITSAGRIFNRNVHVDGSGSWTLADSLCVFNSFYFVRGNFSTTNQQVFTHSFISQEGNQRNLLLGKTYWTLRNQDPQNNARLEWAMNPVNLALDAGKSTIDFSNSSGSMMSGAGGPGLHYNVVLFAGGDAQLSNQSKQSQVFDTISCIGSLNSYGSNTTTVLKMLNVYQIFKINSNDTFSLAEWIVPKACDGRIEMSSTSLQGQAYLHTTKAIAVQNLSIQDILRIGVGTATANNSIDLGNNQGWIINNKVGRDLYWVGKGGRGSWYDQANWAAVSGGTGGECIPNDMDNVFFDVNSFDGPDQRVVSRDQQAYCKNMSWTGVSNNPINFDMWILNAYGSVDLPENKFGGISELRLLSPDQNQTLLTRGYHIYNAHLNGAGSWILQDTLSATNLYQRSGEFNSNGKPVTTETFFMLNDNFNGTTLKMGNSHWRITRNGSLSSSLYSFYIGPEAIVDAGTSLLEFTNTSPTYITYSDVKFHNVLFSNVEGTSSLLSNYEAAGDKFPKVSTFNRIEIRNSGIILGENVIDSLIFTAGKTYDLDAAHAQTINKYFQAVGNPCDSIALRSTQMGNRAIVKMDSGVVRANFIQMRDQQGVGSTRFFAGANSTNINDSNENWVFGSPNVDVGILGKDVVLCQNNSITLDAYTLNFNEKYRWSDGSTQATLPVSQIGTYHVAVTYENGCALHDTVKVLAPSAFKLNLINDTTVCSGQSLVLDADINLQGVNYRWQDGSSNAQIKVNQAGIYKVVVDLSGCTTVVDSTTVRLINLSALNLGRDTSIGSAGSLLLDASKTSGRNYLWSDSSTAPTLRVHTADTFWVEVRDGECTARDTIVVKGCLPLNLSLGRDSILCAGASLDLRSNLGNAIYRWQDGSSNRSFKADTTGLYWLEATVNGCADRDSINLMVQQLPHFELGRDTILCTGETLTLRAISGVNQLQWSTGSTKETITVTNSGVFWAQAVKNNCSFGDSITVTYKSIPTVTLGQDTLVCDDRPHVLRASASKGAQLLWQDGSSRSSLSATAAGTYWVRAANDRCISTDSLELSFRHCIVFKAFTPNAFTPNGNTNNDVFRPFINELVQVKGYELQVFDRWGGPVFRSTDLNTGWDGLIRGQYAPKGVYIYWFKIEYVDDKEQEMNWFGAK